MGVSTLVSAVFGLAILSILKQFLFPKQETAPLPPGPRGKPIVGNLGDLPPPGKKDWEHWLAFKKLYGPISSITVCGQTIVIINDSRVAFDLMEKRSAMYSSRPRMVFAGEMIGWEHTLGLQPYSARFRNYRKVMHRVLGSKAVTARFHPLQDLEVRRFLLRVLNKPSQLLQHIRTEAGAVILKIAYGYTIEPHGRDPLVDLANESMENFSVAGNPGSWLVDTIPFLRHLPDWFPGTRFKKTGNAWRNTLQTTIEKPYAFVKEQMKRGSYQASYLASLFEEDSHYWTPEEAHVAKWTAGSLYTGGADTTVSSLSCFFLAMARYPDIQKKAQEEIDRVCGPNTLPSFADRERLPYIDAMVKEALRWHPVAPMAIPHLCTEDNVYEGYLIPKGAIILPNVWGFTHDPSVYHDPMNFKPERFLQTDTHTPEVDPHTLSFGFGRRICPGRFLADSTIFMSIAQSLAVFNFSTKEGDNTSVDFQAGVVSHPTPYELDIKPRSPAHEELIRSVEKEHPWEESHAKDLEGIVCDVN